MDQRVRRHFVENRLWHGSRMFLPEHRAGTVAKALTEGKKGLISCPTQERLEEIQGLIQQALSRKCFVALQIVEKNGVARVWGVPVGFQYPPGILRLADERGEIRVIPFSVIVGAEDL